MMEKINFLDLAKAVQDAYFHTSLSGLNDHAIKMSVMTVPYRWHYHPNSDETFIGVEGVVIIETKEAVFELSPGTLITIPKNVHHRTLPKDGRTVNLIVEQADIRTIFVDG